MSTTLSKSEIARMKKMSILNFFDRKKEGRELSNFFELNIILEWNGELLEYGSGEGAFHGMKYREIGMRCKNRERSNQLNDYGKKFEIDGDFGKLGNREIKKKGGKKGLKLEVCELKIWSEVCVYVQRKICRYKYDNYEIVREVLNNSKGKVLIHPAMRCNEEKVKGKFWEGKGIVENGKVIVLGGNVLGRLWMEIRDL